MRGASFSLRSLLLFACLFWDRAHALAQQNRTDSQTLSSTLHATGIKYYGNDEVCLCFMWRTLAAASRILDIMQYANTHKHRICKRFRKYTRALAEIYTLQFPRKSLLQCAVCAMCSFGFYSKCFEHKERTRVECNTATYFRHSASILFVA